MDGKSTNAENATMDLVLATLVVFRVAVVGCLGWVVGQGGLVPMRMRSGSNVLEVIKTLSWLVFIVSSPVLFCFRGAIIWCSCYAATAYNLVLFLHLQKEACYTAS